MKLLQWRDPFVLVLIVLIQIVHRFPGSFLSGLLAKGLASTAFHITSRKKKIIEEQLTGLLDRGFSGESRRGLVRGVFREFWEDKVSFPLPRDERTVLRNARIRGMDRLEQALEKGKGVILWESNALSNRARSKQILYAKGFAIHQIHSENHFEGFLNPRPSGTWVQQHLIKRVLENLEMKYVKEIIRLPRSDSLAFTKILLDRLRQNAILCVSGDAHAGKKQVPLAFLDHIEHFPTGMVSLAKISGATLLPIFCISEERGGKCLIIEQPITIDRGMERERGLESGVNQYVRLLESYIVKYPKQYLRVAPYTHHKDDGSAASNL